MSVLFKLSLIAFANTIHTTTMMVGVCSNVSDGIPLKCCPNYRVVGNSCKECWPGTQVINCMSDCPPHYYGRLCSEKCACESCDKVIGCTNATDKSSPEENESSTNSASLLTLSVLGSCIVISFIFCLRIFCILRRTLTKKPTDLAEYDSKTQMALLENHRCSASLTSKTINLNQTTDTETSYDKCHATDSNNMTETTSQNAYGQDDSVDGPYNILKLIVSDKNDHMQITTPLEKLNNTNVDCDTSQMASTVSNIVKTENKESKIAIRRKKSKHQKELFRALDEFKKGSTRDRKKLRYSFTKSTELF